ncbi:LPD38 domain-containing protein [Desulfosporosinus hippei]|uniref:Large polyvalent protein associated domain-containing protein n=1 Tax=Desulfosporosinus hippei DSM 8344 TaxID=1121419 RepID=A0A1G7UIC6_9FIRM|nr:LPD38 domain-containing protein [Desulfosporosinus hippei]SDG47263.1 hypothetical protein SAMN05443529_103153 [Desulfosporosinus hippei DSM 8344]
MARSLDEIFGNQQNKPRTLDQIFAPPSPDPLEATRTPLAMQMRPAHSNTIETAKPSLKSAFIGGTLNSNIGKALTPVAEKIAGRKVDLSTLPQPETLGQKAVSMGSNLVTDLPLWIAGDALLAKPLGALAKTAPVSKAIGALPKALIPALGTGVRAGATYGGVVAPTETALEGDGLQGLIEREKQVPLMALGGTALHGAGQLVGKGVREGIDLARINKLTKSIDLPKVNPLEEVQNAYKVPSLRDARANQLNKTFADTSNNMRRTGSTLPKQGLNPSEMAQQKQLNAQAAFGEPRDLKKYNSTTSEQRAFQELQDGIAEAQNYVRHTDVLAPYPPGTTVEAAYADVKANTGVDLPKLIGNWERAQAKRTSLNPQELKMGKAAGVIPPLKPRDVPKPVQNNLEGPLPKINPPNPQPLTWTNKEGIPSAGPLPIQSITEDTLRRLPRSQPKTPTVSSETTDIDIPIVNGRVDVANVIERPRVMNATIERPSTSNPSLSLPRVGETMAPGNADTFRTKVDRSPAKSKPFSETLSRVRTQFVDDLAPLENLEKNITGKVASAEDSLYKQGRLFRGSPERADELIKSRLAPVIKGVEKSGKTSKDLGDYALAVHARDVNAKGINSGFTDAEINATIQKYGTPEMEAARKELMKISNESLDSLAESGLISRELVTALREKHPNYMPLFRLFDDDKVEFAAGVSKTLANVTAPLNRLVGSDRKVIDPIESMVKNIYRSISAVDRNKVASQLSKLADKDTNGAFIRRLAEGEERGRLNTVYAMEGGKKVQYEVQPDVYKALLNLDRESSNMLIKLLQKPAGLLRSGATLTPEFSLRNPIRDIPAAFSVSKSGFNPITDIPRALFDIIRTKQGKETLYNQFLKDNAGYGNIISMDRKVHQEVLKDILSKPQGNKFVNVINPKSWISVLRAITDVSESATKLGEYRAALRSGASRPEAAYRARDIMDFGRAGSSIRESNKIIAFLNASIQGKSKLYRAIKEDPIGVTTRAFVSITLPTIGAYMAQRYLSNDEQKKTISDAPSWLTSTFWLVPIPGTSQVARIPKPFDLAPIFANLPERALRYLETNDPEAFEGFGKETLTSFSIPTMITALTPFLEGMANYSFFKQGPIIPQRESDLNFPDQYDIRTTGTAKLFAKGVNELTGGQGALKNFGSPRIMDNTIRGLTAGLGSYATSAIDFIAETSGLVEKKQRPARNISDLPLLRAFLAPEYSSGKSMDKLYNEKDQLLRARGSAKIESSKAAFPQEKRLKKLNTVSDEISKITKEIRKIENDTLMNPLSKRERINSLTDKRNELAKRVMAK